MTYLLVELEADLEQCRTTRHAVWLSIKQVAGIRSITDMRMVSPHQLEGICGIPDAESLMVPKRRTRRRVA